MRPRLDGVGEEAGRLDDDVGTDVAPLQVAGLALGEDLQELVADLDAAVAGRIRRLLAMADKRAADMGIPDTEANVTPEMLEGAP